MGQAQSDPGISSEKKQEKGEKNKRGKSLGGFLCMFSCLTCVGRQDQQTKDIQICLQMVEEEPIIPPPTVMEDDEERLLPLSGPLVLYVPVWRPAPSSTPVLQLTKAGKLLLGDMTTLDTLTFFMTPVWLKNLKVHLTMAGEMTFEDPALSRGKHEAEKEASISEEEPEWSEKDLPLVDLWNASDFQSTRRSAGRLQTLEEVCQLLQVVMNNRTQLWWRRHLHIDLLNPEGSVAVSTIELEVTGVQLLAGRQMSHVMSHHINTRKEFLYFEDGQEVDVMTTFEGFVEAGGETRTTNWSCSNTESTFKDPPPRSPHASPPSPPFEEDFEEDVEEPMVQVPLMQSYFAYKGSHDFEGKLAALREAFEVLTNTNESLNFISHAGRMVLGGLAELNDQITQINFLDLFFELVLLGLLKGKTVQARPNGFLQLLFGVIFSIQPPGQSWSESAEHFLLRIKSQMQCWMDAIFDFEEHLYGCTQNLSGEVLGNLEMQVEFLLSSLD